MIQEGKRYQYQNGAYATVTQVLNNTVYMSNGDTIHVDKFNQYCNPVSNTTVNNIYDSYQDNQLLNEAYNNTTNYNTINAMNTNTSNLNVSSAILGVLSDFNSGRYETRYNPIETYQQESAPMLTDETGVIIQPSNQMYIVKPSNYSPIQSQYSSLPGLQSDNYDVDEFMTPEEIEAVNRLKENAPPPVVNPNLAFQPNPYINGMPAQQTQTQTQPQQQYNNNQQRAQAPISPAKEVLNKIKKNYEIDFIFKLKTLIPNLEYLKMSQENLDCDLFEALAEELTNNFMNNPSLLYNAILSQLKGDDMVEIFKNAVKVEPKKIETPKKTKTKTKTTKKATKKEVSPIKETIKAETKTETLVETKTENKVDEVIEETYDKNIYPKVETIETIVLTPINK